MSRIATDTGSGWRNSAVHRDVDNRHAKWVFRIILLIAIALAPLAVYLLQTMSYVQTAYAIEDARAREARLVESEHRLTIERDLLQSLPEVDKRVAFRLGLARPPASHVVVVSPAELDGASIPGRASSRPKTR